MSLHSVQAKLLKFEIDYDNALGKANEMRLRAEDDPTPERVEAAAEAREALLVFVRTFRSWCVQKSNGIRDLDEPTFTADARALWLELADEIGKWPPKLDIESSGVGSGPEPK